MIVLALIFLWSQFGVPAASSDNTVIAPPTKRLLVTHVSYFNDNGTKEERKSAENALDKEVAKDILAYRQYGIQAVPVKNTWSNAMTTKLFQEEHLEIQPPPIKPRD